MELNYLDLAFAIPLAWGAYKGFTKGFVIEIASLLGLVLGIYAGLKFSSLTAEWLSKYFDIANEFMPLASFVVTFLIVVIGIYSLAKILEKVVDLVALTIVNKLAGLLFGVVKVAFILSVIILVLESFNKQFQFIPKELKNSSILYNPIEKIAPIVIPSLKELGESIPEDIETLV